MGIAMVEQVKQHFEAIRSVCRRYRVARLELFGSAAVAASFDPARSDVDFIVGSSPDTDLGPWLATYFELSDALEGILGRTVDLVMEGALKNELFRREVERTREVVYAARAKRTVPELRAPTLERVSWRARADLKVRR